MNSNYFIHTQLLSLMEGVYKGDRNWGRDYAQNNSVFVVGDGNHILFTTVSKTFPETLPCEYEASSIIICYNKGFLLKWNIEHSCWIKLTFLLSSVWFQQK